MASGIAPAGRSAAATTVGAASFAVSLRIRPSRNVTIRLACAAMSGSWVTSSCRRRQEDWLTTLRRARSSRRRCSSRRRRLHRLPSAPRGAAASLPPAYRWQARPLRESARACRRVARRPDCGRPSSARWRTRRSWRPMAMPRSANYRRFACCPRCFASCPRSLPQRSPTRRKRRPTRNGGDGAARSRSAAYDSAVSGTTSAFGALAGRAGRRSEEGARRGAE